MRVAALAPPFGGDCLPVRDFLQRAIPKTQSVVRCVGVHNSVAIVFDSTARTAWLLQSGKTSTSLENNCMSNKGSVRGTVTTTAAMLAVCLAFVGGITGMSSAFGNSRDDNKALIQQMFRDVIEPDSFDEQVVSRYFSPSYVQKVDGKTLDFAGFSDHLRAVKTAVTNTRVTFDVMMAEGNKVIDIHRVVADKRTGGKVTVRVVALFEIKDGKIVRCDEDTHLEDGAAADKDLGSRSSKP